jgi:hypothetical protein
MPPESSDGALDDRARTVEAVRLLDPDGGRSADTHLRVSPLPPVDRCADTYADDHCVSDQSRDPPPGSYTAVVRGSNDSTGVALVEIYYVTRQ